MRSRRLLLALAAALCAAPAPALAATAPAARPSIVNPIGSASVPWQVGILPAPGDDGFPLPLPIFCGGTLRDATHVITAAHCVDTDDAADIAVVAGLVSRDHPDAGATAVAVSAISSHPAYGDYRNDLAILTLASALPLDGATIGDLPVVAAGESVVGDDAFISGWGDTDPLTEGGQQPDRLQYAVVGVYPDSACGGYGAQYDASVMLCAGSGDGAGTVDSCQGDSGGPLARISGDDTADALIGVVSFGRGCADPDYPGIYTKLSNPDLHARATDPNPPARLEPTTPPAISGTPQVGQTLTCAGAGWTLPPAQQQVLWLSAAVRGDTAEDVRAEGDQPTLALGDALTGRVVTCIVRGVGAGGWREQQASAVGPVAARPAGGGGQTPPPAGGGQTPPPGNGGGQPRGGTQPPPADIVPPTVSITRRSCAKLRCTLTIDASDLASEVRSATVAYQRLSGCPKGRKGKRCRAVKTVAAKRSAAGVFSLRTPKLAAARWRFTVVAVDAAGNRSVPRRIELKVKR